MDTTFLVTLALNADRYNSGVRWFQWSVTGVGAGILMCAAGLLFQKPKPGTSATSIRIQKGTGAVLAVIGVGVIVYAWVAHSTV